MSLGHGASIVRDGLIFHLDAANVKSYPGSGTAWNDLSGNANNATLNNGPLYSPDNNGSIDFDRSNDYALTENDMLNPNIDFTFGCWVNVDVLDSVNTIISTYAVTGALQIRFTGTAIQIVDSYSIGVGTFPDFSASPVTWYNVIVARSGNTYSLYVNGEFQSSFTSSNVYTRGPRSIGINRYTEYFGGKISAIQAYQRVLSESEIQQNFNALRGRYGI